MIKLQTLFKMNADKTGEMTFEQVKRTDKVALYKRTYPDGRLHSYEVFEIFIVKAGAKLPNGVVVAEDYEKYCTANSRNAYFCNSEFRALIRYNELISQIAERTIINVADENTVSDDAETLVSEIVTTGKRGRKPVVRPALVFPTSKTWTMRELVTLNNAHWNQPTAYIELQKLIKTNLIKISGEQNNTGNKGKPAKLYSKV